MAAQWWENGTRAKKNGDIATAYHELMKFTTFVLQRLPSHLSYNLGKFEEDKVGARAKCIRVFEDLEAMQPKLVEMKMKERSLNLLQQIPSVPPDHRLT